jgi:hypothetical protein
MDEMSIDDFKKTLRLHLYVQKLISIGITLLIVFLVVYYFPHYIKFKDFTISDVTGLLTALLITAVLIERTIELIMHVWREPDKQKIKNEVKQARSRRNNVEEATEEEVILTSKIKCYEVVTKSLSVVIAFLLGLIISALGVRILQPLMDHTAMMNISDLQARLFTGVDVFITGALIGGGSEGMHKIIDLILSYVEKNRQRLKNDVE